MVEGIPVNFEDCPRYAERTFRGRLQACKCERCQICGPSKALCRSRRNHGHEGENVVWGHQFKPASLARPIPAEPRKGKEDDNF